MNTLPLAYKRCAQSHSQKTDQQPTKRSFALAEVCVAMIIIGISISYVFSSINQTIQRYSTLRQEIGCHEIADEYLGRFIAAFLTLPPEFGPTVGGADAYAIDGNYEIFMNTEVCNTTEENDEPEKQVQKKAALVAITITVHPIGNDNISASRSTKLCFSQEGS